MDHPTFKWNTYFMRILGFYKPKSDWSFQRKVVYYVGILSWLLALLGGIFSNILYLIWIEKIEKISDIAMNILYIELYGSILLRSMYFSKDNSGIDHLANRMATEFRQSSELSFKPKTMEKIKTINDWLTVSWTIFCLVAGLIMSAAGVVKHPRELTYAVWTWYDLNDPFNYSITLFVQFISIEVMLLSYANLDMLNSTFMLLTAAQVDVLATDFTNVVHNALKKNDCTEEEILDYISYENDEGISGDRLKQNEKINMTLETARCKYDLISNINYCIEHHQNLLSFIDEYQVFISPYLLVEVNFNFSYLIFMLFIMATTEATSMYVPMSLYISACVAQIFMAMYFGDRLSSRIETMKTAFYEMPWYLCDKHFLANYKIVQIRMSKPIAVTAGKLLKMSLDTFLEFIKKAFSFFSVLRQVN